ncbi:hypothetical protein MMC27_001860 [Xylographa pallens]|nr:hypothetical protein [Xylographa pallens]
MPLQDRQIPSPGWYKTKPTHDNWGIQYLKAGLAATEHELQAIRIDVETALVQSGWGPREMNTRSAKKDLDKLLSHVLNKHAALLAPIPETFAKKALLALAHKWKFNQRRQKPKREPHIAERRRDRGPPASSASTTVFPSPASELIPTMTTIPLVKCIIAASRQGSRHVSLIRIKELINARALASNHDNLDPADVSFAKLKSALEEELDFQGGLDGLFLLEGVEIRTERNFRASIQEAMNTGSVRIAYLIKPN